MKLLLDENIPFRLYKDFPLQHPAFSVSFMKWNSYSNGKLLRAMVDEGFEGLVTWDQNIEYQQNFKKYPVSVFVFCTFSNEYVVLSPLVSKIIDLIESGVKPGPYLVME